MPTPLQLQLGRYYRADDGETYEPTASFDGKTFVIMGTQYAWNADGSPVTPGSPRLLSEVPVSHHSRPTSWELFPVGQPKAGPFDVEEPKSECKHKSVCIVDRDPMEAVVVRCGEACITITQEEWPILSQIITTALSHCRKTTKP